jgi:hypothetical protein
MDEQVFFLADGSVVRDDRREALWQAMQHPLSPIGHVGLYNPFLDEFCLKKAHPPATHASDLRLKMTGKKCLDWEFKDLLWILLGAKHLEWEKSATQWTWIDDKKRALLMLSSTRAGQKFLETYGHQLDERVGNNMELWNRLVFLSVNVRQLTCDILFQWLCENKLLFEDLNCGHQNKKR